jgi:hypothetical protein
MTTAETRRSRRSISWRVVGLNRLDRPVWLRREAYRLINGTGGGLRSVACPILDHEPLDPFEIAHVSNGS